MSEKQNPPEGIDPFEPLPPQHGLGAAGKASVAATAAALNLAVPGISVPTAAVTAGILALGDKLNKQQERRLYEMLGAAAKESGLSAEEVVRHLLDREDLMLLAAEAIEAARRSRLEGKARSLGQSLGSILQDDARLDEEAIWIRILSIVEPPHVRILGLFLEHTATMGTGSTLWGRKSQPQRIEDVGEMLGLGDAVLPLIQDLLAAGLLASAGVPGVNAGIPDVFGQSIHATTLGAQLFARLSQAGLIESN